MAHYGRVSNTSSRRPRSYLAGASCGTKEGSRGRRNGVGHRLVKRLEHSAPTYFLYLRPRRLKPAIAGANTVPETQYQRHKRSPMMPGASTARPHVKRLRSSAPYEPHHTRQPGDTDLSIVPGHVGISTQLGSKARGTITWMRPPRGPALLGLREGKFGFGVGASMHKGPAGCARAALVSLTQ